MSVKNKKGDSYKEYVEHELLREVDGITIRRMFNGHGIYRHGVFIGLIHDGTVFFKVDAVTQGKYEAEGSRPFVYTSRGKEVTLSFWEVPASAADNPQVIVSWALTAYEAALRAKKKQ